MAIYSLWDRVGNTLVREASLNNYEAFFSKSFLFQSLINSLEVTLRDTDSVKHKIQLAQLRSGRHAFKHAGRRPAENAW